MPAIRSAVRTQGNRDVSELSVPMWGEGVLESGETLEEFLRREERRAFRMAQIATGDPDEALDIVQDAMLAFVRRYSGRPAQERGPLFQRVLTNRITDWHRRTNLRRRFRTWLARDEDNGEDPLEQMPDPAPDGPAQRHEQAETAQAIEAALRALPLRQQQAFLLRAWEGLDVASTARAMGCSQGSVKTHYSRAVRALRERLGDEWHE